MNEKNNTRHLTVEDIDAYINYSPDSEGIRDIERRAVLNGEVDVLIEAIMANHELDSELENELLGEDFFDVDTVVNQNDNKNDICV